MGACFGTEKPPLVDPNLLNHVNLLPEVWFIVGEYMSKSERWILARTLTVFADTQTVPFTPERILSLQPFDPSIPLNDQTKDRENRVSDNRAALICHAAESGFVHILKWSYWDHPDSWNQSVCEYALWIRASEAPTTHVLDWMYTTEPKTFMPQYSIRTVMTPFLITVALAAHQPQNVQWLRRHGVAWPASALPDILLFNHLDLIRWCRKNNDAFIDAVVRQPATRKLAAEYASAEMWKYLVDTNLIRDPTEQTFQEACWANNLAVVACIARDTPQWRLSWCDFNDARSTEMIEWFREQGVPP